MSKKIAENIRQLSETSDRQKQFIHNMAHEMKTPLTSIIGFSDILYIKENLGVKERREYDGIIGKEAQRMEDLSAKLVELFHMQQGKIDLVPVALDERVGEAVRAIRPVTAKKELQITGSLQRAVIMGDVILLDSLIYNLLDNARKACEREGHIDVRLVNNGEEIKLVITDNGVGMSKETIERITEPFYMADKARSRSEGGAGLGMALCQEIVKLHGAAWKIESRLGKGSRISIIWPADIIVQGGEGESGSDKQG